MYKLKKGFTLPKEFKIVVTPEQSEALQKHLFKKWGANDQVRNTEFRYIIVYCGIKALFIFDNITSFAAHTHIQIEFDHYFEKVQESFPEKWCIEVTEGNYKELNTWMHNNWKNYPRYTDRWGVDTHSYYETVFFMSEYNKGHSDFSIPCGYTLITTEQFRAKYGKEQKAKENESEQSYDLRKEIHKYSACELSEKAKAVRENLKNSGVFRLEIQRLQKENEQLKHKLLMLTSKIETAKTVLD